MKKISKFQQNHEKMEKLIFETGIELFKEYGFEETTLQDIARKAGISTSTLHRYFPSKVDLLLKVSREKTGEFAAYMSSLPEDMDIWSKIRMALLYNFEKARVINTTLLVQLSAGYKNRDVYKKELENKAYMSGFFKDILIVAQQKQGVPVDEGECAFVAEMIINAHFNMLVELEANESFDEVVNTDRFLKVLRYGMDCLLSLSSHAD